MKICLKCNQNKEESFFHKCKSNKDGLYNWCSLCKREYDKKYRKSDKIQSLYNSEEYKSKKSKEQFARLNSDLRYLMYRNTKARALRSSIPFNIELEDIIIPDKCPLLEIELLKVPYGERRGFHMNSPSIDKINPELGYIKGNIQVISMKANAMKYSATKEELIKFCTNMLRQITNGNINN